MTNATDSLRAIELIDAFADAPTPHISGNLRNKLPTLPSTGWVLAKQSGFREPEWISSNGGYTEEDMLQFQRDTIEACCQVLLESGFKSNGVPAYEHLVDKLRSMK